MFATPLEVVRAKRMALAAYAKWIDAKLEPLVEGWVAEGCDAAEISKRLDAYMEEVREGAARTLRLVTLAALKDGAFGDG
jgi:hypothetical protein